MKNETKKIILNLITLAAVASSIVALFAPVTSFNLKDIYEDIGREDKDYWKADIFFLFQDYYLYSYGSGEAHTYYLLYFYRHSTEEWAEDELTQYDLEGSENQIASSRILANMILFIFGAMFLILFFYFTYRTIKKCGKERTKDCLYAGLSALIIAIGFTLSVRYIFSMLDVNNLGYTNYLKLGLGFYYMLISACLYIIAYFFQHYIDFSEQNLNGKNDKNID